MSVDMILDGGPCEVGIESTIIQVRGDAADLAQTGRRSIESLREELSSVSAGDPTPIIVAPGQLPYHYSPIDSRHNHRPHHCPAL